MEVLKQAGKFLFGDSKLSADDIQKLKADFRSVSCIVEEFLDLREKLISEEIQISCQSCAKKKKIQNTKNALYVATYQTTPKSLRESSTEDKDYDKRTTYGKETTQCESSVDRSSRDEEYKHDGMNDSFITKGEESCGDVKTDANDDKIEKEKKVLEDKLNKTEKNLQKAEKVILDLRKKMEEAESKYDGELKSAVIELSKITNEKEENEKSIGILESKIKQLNLELSALKENFDKKDKECKHYSSCLERNKQTHETIVSQMNTEQDSLRADLCEKRSLIETMKRRKSELAQGCHKKDEEIKGFHIQISTLRRECRDKDKHINSLERKVKESERNTTSKAEQIEKLNQVVETLNSNGAQKDEEISSLKERIDDLLSDNNNKGEQINFLGEELKTMQHILEDERKGHKSIKASLEEEILGLKADLTAWEERTKKTLVINFHTSLKQSLALPAQQHIEQCLKEKCQLDNVTLEVKQYKSPESTPGPILVLCMNVSRLGTDVKEALKGTPGNYEVLVVVLHHKEVHALPSQASDRVLTGEEYKQLGAIVDAAFWTGRGMYDCDLNKLATEKIYNFVSGFVTR